MSWISGRFKPSTERQLTRLHILFGEVEIAKKERKIVYCQEVIGREIGSTKELDAREVELVIAKLNGYRQQLQSEEIH